VLPEQQVLDLVGELSGLLDLEEFCGGMLAMLRKVVPSDWSALNEVPVEVPNAVSITEPPVPAELHKEFARLAMQNPVAEYFHRSGEGRATRISDLITQTELHNRELYQRVYGPLGVEYQIAFTLPSGSNRILGVSLSRRSHDFTESERDLLNLARPHLVQAYRNALDYTRLAQREQITLDGLRALGLTRRQSEALRLVAIGYSTQDVADALGIRPRTVEKHLEDCYRTLGVKSRAEAARIARSRGLQSDL
jgi:DNA-binding CsgD family transcriptional regulator